jgi:hypothetical protein
LFFGFFSLALEKHSRKEVKTDSKNETKKTKSDNFTRTNREKYPNIGIK